MASMTIGARSEAQLADNLQAAQRVLPVEQRERLDRVSQPELPYPYSIRLFQDKDRVPA
jgi:aryl-alcohol dehydrogenase-like predicted oxidoreductase